MSVQRRAVKAVWSAGLEEASYRQINERRGRAVKAVWSAGLEEASYKEISARLGSGEVGTAGFLVWRRTGRDGF